MNLVEVRTKFRDISGRFDLVNADFSDNGADFYIQNGSKYLDLLAEIRNSTGVCFRLLKRGLFSLSVPNCRVIKSVRASNSLGCWDLEKKNLKDMISEFFTSLTNAQSFGNPGFYSLIPARYIEISLTADNFESFLGSVNIPAEKKYEENALIFNCPLEMQTTFEINGMFYSEKLVSDEDTNFWSSQHPMLLIMATMRGLEIINRNTQGVNDWNRSLLAEIDLLNRDFVDEGISEVNNTIREA